MLRNIDFSSWQSVIATIIGLALVTQINERLRTLIAAYKTLGGSFTGNLAVDPAHLRDLRQRSAVRVEDGSTEDADPAVDVASRSDRARRIRDTVEAALSDIILLGTEEQVRLAAAATQELVAGRPVHTHDLVVSLRDFIRSALDLDPIPVGVTIPMQGPARPSASGSRGKNERGKDEGRSSGGGGGGMGGGASGGGGGFATGVDADDPNSAGHHA